MSREVSPTTPSKGPQNDDSVAMDEEWKQVVALNIAGNRHFLAENFREAISLFEKSLIKAKAAMKPQPPHTSHSFKRAQGDGNEESNIQLELRDLEDSTHEGKSYEETRLESDDQLVSRCCIWIPDAAEGTLMISDCTTFSISIVYNLGLSYHLVGLQQSSQPLLEKANRYYNLAWKLCSQVQLRYDAHSCMHLLNNWAALLGSLGDKFRSRQLCKELFCMVFRSGDVETAAARRHYQLFMRNLLVLFIQPTHGTGAA
ncbi:MAG: hypothetical protein SGBAC_007898 [Bacillariaceae sp.]